jgi:NAD(P)-dependent dehydrogenase (short-subunit alcohol dehydrogenase family)
VRQGASLPSFPAGSLGVVIGASGAIGGALLDSLQHAFGVTRAIGFSRKGLPSLDLTSEASIASAACQLLQSDAPPRLIIDATGFLHGDGVSPEKSLRQLDAANLAKAFSLNVIGPALLMKHFFPLLPRSGKAVFATLSARVGSIGDNHLGGWYGYRASKAALNQLVRTAAIELKRRQPEAICVALHPGTVDSRLSAPFRKIGLAVRSPAEAAGGLLEVIDRLRPEDSGGFFDYRGEPVPW